MKGIHEAYERRPKLHLKGVSKTFKCLLMVFEEGALDTFFSCVCEQASCRDRHTPPKHKPTSLCTEMSGFVLQQSAKHASLQTDFLNIFTFYENLT